MVRSLNWCLQVQDYFTYAKMFALILISITGMVQLGHGKTEFFTFENSETDITIIALSFYSGLFSYTGWNYLNFIIEEMKVIRGGKLFHFVNNEKYLGSSA